MVFSYPRNGNHTFSRNTVPFSNCRNDNDHPVTQPSKPFLLKICKCFLSRLNQKSFSCSIYLIAGSVKWADLESQVNISDTHYFCGRYSRIWNLTSYYRLLKTTWYWIKITQLVSCSLKSCTTQNYLKRIIMFLKK